MSENSLSTSKIIRIDVFEVIVPAHPNVIDGGRNKPLHMLPVAGKSSWSVQFDELPKLIVKMTLSDQTIGWGELYRDHNWLTVEAIIKNLLGTKMNDLVLQDLPMPLCREYDGFECAIWDARAKQMNVPLYELLGGKLKDKVKVGAWSGHRPAIEIGEVAQNFQLQGYDCIKLKCDLTDDISGWCAAIAEKAPGMHIILDPNQRWKNAGSARRIIRQLEVYGNVLLLEDPIPKWMLQDYAELRRFSSIPIVSHVSLPYIYQGQRPHDAINALMHGAVDGFNFNGGLAKFKELDAIAKTANMFCWHGSEVDLGILEAMYVHQAAAASSCVWPSDIFGRMIRSHDLLSTPLSFDPPYVSIPKGKGLGIEVDRDAIEKFLISKRSFSA